MYLVLIFWAICDWVSIFCSLFFRDMLLLSLLLACAVCKDITFSLLIDVCLWFKYLQGCCSRWHRRGWTVPTPQQDSTIQRAQGPALRLWKEVIQEVLDEIKLSSANRTHVALWCACACAVGMCLCVLVCGWCLLHVAEQIEHGLPTARIATQVLCQTQSPLCLGKEESYCSSEKFRVYMCKGHQVLILCQHYHSIVKKKYKNFHSEVSRQFHLLFLLLSAFQLTFTSSQSTNGKHVQEQKQSTVECSQCWQKKYF